MGRVLELADKRFEQQDNRKRPARTAFRIVFEREMVCSLICKQMSKRDDSYGSIRSGAATAVDHC